MWNESKYQIKLYIIRHGQTAGNAQGRYVGCMTDEPVTEEGQRMLKKASFDLANDCVFVSPLMRAMQTAGICFPDKRLEKVQDLREMDFGDFEYKNYSELNGNPQYQAWIDSGGTATFPNGEDKSAFIERTVGAVTQILSQECARGCKDVAIVAHGGSVMSLMSHLTGSNYYDFQVKNGDGYLLNLEVGLENEIRVISYDRISCRICD